MGCGSRNYPPDPWSTAWRQCGYYNDWQMNGNFCMPKFEGGNKDSSYCANMGYENEWKVRTPSYQQSKDAFVKGGGNSVEALQKVIVSNSASAVAASQSLGDSIFKGSDITNMRGGLWPDYHTKDNKDMGPLFAPNEVGDPIPLWNGWLDRFGYSDETPSCHYDDHRNDNVQGTGCCAHHYLSCGIIGGINVACVRNEFAANRDEYGDIACCFNDLVCDPGASESDLPFAPVGDDGKKTPWYNNNKCFRSNTDNDMRTCNPLSRNLGGKYCRDVLTDYCTGEKMFPGEASWDAGWTGASVNVNESDVYNGKPQPINIDGPCRQLIMRQLSGQFACSKDWENYLISAGELNIDGLLWAQQIMNNIFTKYFTEYGSPLLGPNEDGIEAALGTQDFLFNMCKKFPALCNHSLKTMCADVTEEKMSENPIANKWCGCYMKEEQYTKYSEGSFLVTPECTPFCARDGVIPRVSDVWQPLFCQQSICIINNVLLDMVQTEGEVNFSNVCGNCGPNKISHHAEGTTSTSTSTEGGNTTTDTEIRTTENNTNQASSCQCKLDNINFSTVDAKFKGLNLATNCGGSDCKNSNGDSIPCVSGKDILPKINLKNIEDLAKSSKFKKIFILSIGVIVSLGLFYILFGTKKKLFSNIIGDIFSTKPKTSFTYKNGYLN